MEEKSHILCPKEERKSNMLGMTWLNNFLQKKSHTVIKQRSNDFVELHILTLTIFLISLYGKNSKSSMLVCVSKFSNKYLNKDALSNILDKKYIYSKENSLKI